MPSLARLRLTTALLLCQRVASWITITQARYGTSIERIRNESRGINIGSPDKTLGHLWSLPVNGFDQKGLGGSITWAWDSRMCAQLLPPIGARALTQCSITPRQTQNHIHKGSPHA